MADTREHFIGIDFGTSKCVTTVYNPRSRTAQVVRNAEREERTPSAVLYHSDGRVLVGRPALTECEINEEERANLILSCKRFIADDDYQYDVPGDPTAKQAATEIFRKLHRDLTHEFSFAPTRTVVTVPAIFTPVQRLAIREAAQTGGFTEVELLEEPVAAAITYSEQGFDPGERFLIYDLGAGTFDLALLRLVEARSESSKPVYEQALPPMGLRFGGDDIDETVYRLLDRKCRETYGAPLAGDGRQKTHLIYRCRLQKELLSGGTVTPFSYISPTLKQRVEFTLTREEFDTLVAEQIMRTVEPVRNMIVTARRKLGLPDRGEAFPLDDLVLVGGSTELRQIPELLEAELSAPMKHLREWGNRDVAVALGAAYQALRLWGGPRQSNIPTWDSLRDGNKATAATDVPPTLPFPIVPPVHPPLSAADSAPVNPWNVIETAAVTSTAGAIAAGAGAAGAASTAAPPGIMASDFGGANLPPISSPPPPEPEKLMEASEPTTPETSPPVDAPTLAFSAFPESAPESEDAPVSESRTEATADIPQAADERPPVPAPFPGPPPIAAARLAIVVPAIAEEISRTPGIPARVALFLENPHQPDAPRQIGQGFLTKGLETTVSVRLGRASLFAQIDDGSPAQEFHLDCAFTSVYTLYLRYDPQRRRFAQSVEPGPDLNFLGRQG